MSEEMNDVMLISDAARAVNVENHVLRYWEEELHLPIKRNELGHRYYTQEDVERFKQIKSMKERGLQLKAIKMILKNGRIDILPDQEAEKEKPSAEQGEKTLTADSAQTTETESEDEEAEDAGPSMAIDIVDSRDVENEVMRADQNVEHEVMRTDRNVEHEVVQDSREDKSRRLQWLLQQLIRETLQENNEDLCREIKESVVKELDYQFRAQEEREEQRDRRQEERNEEYYKKMDELLRKKRAKKKRHSIF